MPTTSASTRWRTKERKADSISRVSLASTTTISTPMTASRARQLPTHRFGVRIVWVDEKANPGGTRNKLAQKAQLFRPKVAEQKVHPGGRTRPARQARDQAELDRIMPP